MAALRQIVHVQICDRHLRHSSGVGEDMAASIVNKNYGDACGRAAGDFFHTRNFHAALRKPLECNGAESVVSHARDEANRYANGSEIMRKVLQEESLAENTIFVFLSDHGCHFMTRNQEYKRSTHNSSLRVPLIIDGPGFEGAQQVPELVGMTDIAPTLLQAAGVPVPESWKGRSLMPLLNDATAREMWPNQQLVQISESMTGRAICTRDWTYCVADPTGATGQPDSTNYHEYQMYDQRNDPYELVNLAGRKEYRHVADELRGQLVKLMTDAGEAAPKIADAKLYP